MTDLTREAVADTQASLKAAVDVALMFGKPSIECDTSGLRTILTALSNAEAQRDAALARVGVLEAALKKIERWFGEFPKTGKFWDDEKTRPVSYGSAFGSTGERDFMRQIARAALSPAPTVKGEV